MIPSNTTDAEIVSRHAGLDSAHEPSAAPDPDHPHDAPHTSHDWVLFDRWAGCEACGMRDHWPGAGDPCVRSGPAKVRAAETLTEALARLRVDLEAFGEWWRSKGLGDTRPDHAEWTAEFLEWTRTPGGRL